MKSPRLHGPPKRGPLKRVREPNRILDRTCIYPRYIAGFNTLPTLRGRSPSQRAQKGGAAEGGALGGCWDRRCIEGISPFYPARLGEPGFRDPEFGLARISVASLCRPQELGVLTNCRLHVSVSVHKVHAGRTNRTRACEVPPAPHICCASPTVRSMGTRTRPYPHLRCSGKRKPSATAACTQCT